MILLVFLLVIYGAAYWAGGWAGVGIAAATCSLVLLLAGAIDTLVRWREDRRTQRVMRERLLGIRR